MASFTLVPGETPIDLSGLKIKGIRNENNPVAESRSSGRPITMGDTSTGKRIAVIWEEALDNPRIIRPITAHEVA